MCCHDTTNQQTTAFTHTKRGKKKSRRRPFVPMNVVIHKTPRAEIDLFSVVVVVVVVVAAVCVAAAE